MTVTETAKWLNAHDDYLIITHKRPDGDTLCSAAALTECLRILGKRAYMFPNPGTTERYMTHVEEYLAPENCEWKTVVSIDTADETMFVREAECFKGRVDLAVDHHGTNPHYAASDLVVPERSSCGEIIFEVIKELKGEITQKEAELLYIAVSTDTGCFAYGNTNENTLAVAGELVKYGAPNAALNKKFFRTKSKCRVMLEGRMFSELQFFHDGRTCVSKVTLGMLGEIGATENDLDDIANIPGVVEGVIAGVVIRETEDGKSKISVRTRKREECDASEVCRAFGGGGHGMAAGCTLDTSVSEAERLIVAEIGKQYK